MRAPQSVWVFLSLNPLCSDCSIWVHLMDQRGSREDEGVVDHPVTSLCHLAVSVHLHPQCQGNCLLAYDIVCLRPVHWWAVKHPAITESVKVEGRAIGWHVKHDIWCTFRFLWRGIVWSQFWRMRGNELCGLWGWGQHTRGGPNRKCVWKVQGIERSHGGWSVGCEGRMLWNEIGIEWRKLHRAL